MIELSYFTYLFLVVKPFIDAKVKAICQGHISRSHFLKLAIALTLAITSVCYVIDLSYFMCVFLEVRPFLWSQAHDHLLILNFVSHLFYCLQSLSTQTGLSHLVNNLVNVIKSLDSEVKGKHLHTILTFNDLDIEGF